MPDFGTEYLQEFASKGGESNKEKSEEANVEVIETKETAQTEEVNSVEEQEADNNIETKTAVDDEPKATEKKVEKTVNEKIAELNDFLNRNPELTEKDYFELKKPVEQHNQDELIRKYLSEKEGLNEYAVKLKMKKFDTEIDEDFDGELDVESEEYLEAQAEKAEILKKAQQYHIEETEKILNANREEVEQTEETHEPTEEEIQEFRKLMKQNYDSAIMKSSNELEGVEIEVNGEKLKIIPEESHRKSMMETGYNIGEHTNKYFSENGFELVKGEEFAKDIIFWQTPETRNLALQKAYEQGVEHGKASQMKLKHNVNNMAQIKHGEGESSGKGKAVEQLYRMNKM